jgi:hypothetical protein
MFLVFPAVICSSSAFAVSKSSCHPSRTHVHIADYLIPSFFFLFFSSPTSSGVLYSILLFLVLFFQFLYELVVSVGSVTVTKLFYSLSGQLFVLSNSLLVSLVELPALDVPGGGVTAGLRTAPSQVRIILRDLSGKASWDASILYCSPEDSVCSHRLMEEETGMYAVKKHLWLYPLCVGYVLVT